MYKYSFNDLEVVIYDDLFLQIDDASECFQELIYRELYKDDEEELLINLINSQIDKKIDEHLATNTYIEELIIEAVDVPKMLSRIRTKLDHDIM